MQNIHEVGRDIKYGEDIYGFREKFTRVVHIICMLVWLVDFDNELEPI